MAEDKAPNEDEENVDGVEGEDGEGEAKPKSKKKLLLIVIPLLLIIGGGAGAYFTGMLDSLLGKTVNCEEITEDDPLYEEHCLEAEPTAEEIAAAEAAAGPGLYYDIPDIRVNLSTTRGKQKFLFLVVKLEVPDQANFDKLEGYVPRVMDHFQTYLRELRIEDLKGSAGIYRLRLELLERVNAAAPEIDVRDVLFQEMLVQ